MIRLSSVIAALLLCPSLVSAATWLIDADRSRVRFKVSHPLSTVEGGFHKFSGVVELHEKEISRSKLSVIIDMEVVLDANRPSVPTRDRYGKMRRSASAVTRISRKAFGLNWSSMLTTGLGDDIDISLDIELVGK